MKLSQIIGRVEEEGGDSNTKLLWMKRLRNAIWGEVQKLGGVSEVPRSHLSQLMNIAIESGLDFDVAAEIVRGMNSKDSNDAFLAAVKDFAAFIENQSF